MNMQYEEMSDIQFITDDLHSFVEKEEEVLVQSANCDEVQDSFCVELKIDPLHNNVLNISDLESLIYGQISNQIVHMNQIALKHNEQEVDLMFYIEDKEHILQVVEIEPDGNCLFGTLSHQLFDLKVGNRSHTTAMKKLRKDAVNHIKNHRKNFETELKGRLYELNEGKKITEMESACTDYVENLLPQSKVWAGAEAIKAVSQMNAVNVLIVNEKGPCEFASIFDITLKRTGLWYFSICDENDTQGKKCDSICDDNAPSMNRNHYNSVVRMDQNDIYEVTKVLAMKVFKKLNKEEEQNDIVIDDSYVLPNHVI